MTHREALVEASSFTDHPQVATYCDTPGEVVYQVGRLERMPGGVVMHVLGEGRTWERALNRARARAALTASPKPENRARRSAKGQGCHGTTAAK